MKKKGENIMKSFGPLEVIIAWMGLRGGTARSFHLYIQMIRLEVASFLNIYREKVNFDPTVRLEFNKSHGKLMTRCSALP